MVLSPGATRAGHFDLCETRGNAARLAPYLVVLQSDQFEALETLIVAPARERATVSSPLSGLHVPVTFGEQALLVTVEELVSLPRGHLGSVVGNIASYRTSIVSALDRLLLGNG